MLMIPLLDWIVNHWIAALVIGCYILAFILILSSCIEGVIQTRAKALQCVLEIKECLNQQKQQQQQQQRQRQQQQTKD